MRTRECGHGAKEIIYKHRIAFMGLWIAFALALIVFPGFEVRGLAMGMIIGGWPALLSEQIHGSQYQHPVIFLAMMMVVSGTTVGLLAWILDKAQMPKAVWILLVLAILTGSAVFAFNGISFEDWKMTPAVSQAMESPEVNYQPGLWDFSKQIVIPRTLAGGLWGLYGIVGLCALFASALLLKRAVGARRTA
jgi:hypothetical protein